MARNPRPVAKFLELSGKRLWVTAMCMEYAMLAEIFMLRAETAVREAAKDAARFVPITLPTTPTAPTIPTETGVAPALRNR